MKDAAVLAPFQYTLDREIYKSLLMSRDNTMILFEVLCHAP